MVHETIVPVLLLRGLPPIHAAWLAGLRLPAGRHIPLAVRRVQDSILSVQTIPKPASIKRSCALRPLQNNRNISCGKTLGRSYLALSLCRNGGTELPPSVVGLNREEHDNLAGWRIEGGDDQTARRSVGKCRIALSRQRRDRLLLRDAHDALSLRSG
jgi:hypothetical protein